PEFVFHKDESLIAVIERFQEGICSLINAPRLCKPIWRDIISDNENISIKMRAIRDFMIMFTKFYDKFETSKTNLYVFLKIDSLKLHLKCNQLVNYLKKY